MTDRMFEFINKPTWNPIRYCSHQCSYCWAKKYGQDTTPKMHWDVLYNTEKEHNEQDFIFACDMGDLFCNNMPSWIIEYIMEAASCTLSKYLFLTKNPKRYLEECGTILEGSNYYLGATIESNRDYPEISNAPLQSARLRAMPDLIDFYPENPRFISIEPILDFDLLPFFNAIKEIQPWAVAVGYDNHNYKLPEPTLAKALKLIEALELAGIKVYRKTLRKAWNEPEEGHQ